MNKATQALKELSNLFDASVQVNEHERAHRIYQNIFLNNLYALAHTVCPFRKNEIIVLPAYRGKCGVQLGRIVKIGPDISEKADLDCCSNILFSICTNKQQLYKLNVELLDLDGKKLDQFVELRRNEKLETANNKKKSPTYESIINSAS